MPLVFVHGIKTREGNEYRGKVQARDELFRTITFARGTQDPGGLRILNPYWGRFGANFDFGHAYLPEGAYEEFGPGDDVFARIVNEHAPMDDYDANKTLVTIAQKGTLSDAVDCLWSAAAFVVPAEPDPGKRPEAAADLADFGRKALAYARANPKPEWVNEVANDQRFTEVLAEEVETWNEPDTQSAGTLERFGAGTRVLKTLTGAAWKLGSASVSLARSGARAVTVLAQKIGETVTSSLAAAGGQIQEFTTREAANLIDPVASMLAQGLHGAVAEGVGDILVYVDTRGTKGNPGKIVNEVATALEAARADAKEKDGDRSVVLVGHSLGGVILYDVLTHFLPDYPCDTLVTVGSQVALFEELHLFGSSVATDRPLTAVRGKIGRWINLFDPKDPLGYSVRRVYLGVEDYEFSTRTNTVLAHTEYFTKPRFFERLRDRLTHHVSTH